MLRNYRDGALPRVEQQIARLAGGLTTEATMLTTSSRVGVWFVLVAALGATACAGEEFSSAASGGAAGSAGAAGSSGSAGASSGGSAGNGAASSDAGDAAQVPVLESVSVVRADGTAVADVDVFSSTSDGKVFAVGKSGVDGKLSIDVPDGGMVSAAYSNVNAGPPTVTQRAIFSETNIAPGQSVTLVYFGTGSPAAPTAPEIKLQFPKGFPPGTASLDVHLPCDDEQVSPAAEVSITNYTPCPGQKLLDVAVVARSAAGAVLGSTSTLANPYDATKSQTAPLPAFAQNSEDLTIAADNVPTGGEFRSTLRLSRASSSGLSTTLQALDAASPKAKTVLTVPDKLFDRGFLEQDVSWQDGLIRRSVTRIDSLLAPFPATSTMVLPIAYAPVEAVSTWDTTEANRPKINWSLGSGNIGTCFLSLTAASRGTDVSFYIAVRPAEHAGFQIPELPSGLESYAPAASDEFLATTVSHVWSPTAGLASCTAVLRQQEEQSVITASRFGDFD
jgi:hypothetical protein